MVATPFALWRDGTFPAGGEGKVFSLFVIAYIEIRSPLGFPEGGEAVTRHAICSTVIMLDARDG